MHLEIEKTNSTKSVNRTLMTDNEEGNINLWMDAGYSDVPTVEENIKELELEKQTSNLTAIETEVEIARQENIKKTDAVNEYQAQFYEVNAAVTNTENKLNLSLIHI